MAEVIRINKNTNRIEDGGVRFFLLEGSEKALLIDTGMNTPDAKKIAESFTDLPLILSYQFCSQAFCNTWSGKQHPQSIKSKPVPPA